MDKVEQVARAITIADGIDPDKTGYAMTQKTLFELGAKLPVVESPDKASGSGDSGDVMTHWNYRVIRRTFSDEHEYGIYETYYNADGSIDFSKEPDPVRAESKDALRQTLIWMMVALDKPVIDYDTCKEIV